MHSQSLPPHGPLPKPLQLNILPSTGFPSPPPSARTSLEGAHSSPVCGSLAFRPRPNRRQSSISYITSPVEQSPQLPRHVLSRSMSLSASRTDSPARGIPPVRELLERQPVTLAERHADLLSQMASKEALCMELRLQLQYHEGELLQLKQRWERVINRSFTRLNESAPPPPSSYIAPVPDDNSQETLLEGIRGGFQDVGRMIAASISEIKPVIAPLPPTPAATPQLRKSHLARRSTASTSNVSKSSTTSLPLSECGSPDYDVAGEDERLIKVEISEEPSALPSILPNKGPSQALVTVGIRPKHCKRQSLASEFSSMSGMGMSSLINVPPMSSWLSTVGNKWDELQRGPTFVKGQERANGILHDITQSIAMAFPPQPLLTSSSSSGVNETKANSTLAVLQSKSSTTSLLSPGCDKDADSHAWLDQSILESDKPASKLDSESYTSEASNDDEWNW